METCSLLGISVSRDSLKKTIPKIIELAKTGKKRASPYYVATLNLDFLSHAFFVKQHFSEEKELIKILQKASLVTADGIPIVWGCRLLGQPLNERVTGADLLMPLLSKAEEQQLSVYFLGGEKKILKNAISIIKKEFKELSISGYDAPMVVLSKTTDPTQNDLRIIKKINAKKPDILILSLGNPKQELWFNRNCHQINVGVAIGLGGTLNFLTKTIKRAPIWIQKSGLEWVHRLSQDPKRLWKRYLRNFFHFPQLIIPSLISHQLAKSPSPLYSVLLKAAPDTPPLLTLATSHFDQSAPIKGHFFYDLRNISHLSGAEASLIANALKKRTVPAHYLFTNSQTPWSIKAHRLQDFLVRKDVNYLKEILISLPSELWIDFSVDSQSSGKLKELLEQLKLIGKKINLTKTQKEIISGFNL